MPEQRMWYLQ